MANGNGEHFQIFPVQHTNGVNANDPLYQFHRHASATHELAVEIMPARREHQFRSMPYLLCWTAESKVNCDENH